MNELIDIIQAIAPFVIEPVKYMAAHPSGTLTVLALGIAFFLFHKSGAGRYVYPWLWRIGLRLSAWALRSMAGLAWAAASMIALFIARKGVNLWRRRFNSGAKPAKYSRSTPKNGTPDPPTATSAAPTLPVDNYDWVVRTLKSMGFTATEARGAAESPEVAAETGLDDQVHAALQQLGPMVSR